MTPHVDLLDEIQPAPFSTVTSATGTNAKVMGMGCAEFMGADGELVGLKDVLWVPDSCMNLISIGRLGDAGVNTGFQQKEKVDFKEIFAPIAKPLTLRSLLAGTAVKGWYVNQIDITTAFLNGVLLNDIYMAQPDGYEDGTSRVCKLKKAIYGLKQAPRCWYEKQEEVLLGGGFKTSHADHSLFLLGEGERLLLPLLHIDDILLFSHSMEQIERTQKLLKDNF
ncbi:unnamed protein product [Closterium sp. NIES-54]